MVKSIKKQRPDLILCISILLLIIIGFVALASASGPLSLELTGTTSYFFKHQILFGLIPGLILSLICYKLDPEVFKKIAFVFFILTVLACLAVFLPKIGSMVAGGKRWIKIFGISVQPAEFLKFGFILYLSAWIHKFKDAKEKFKLMLVPFLLVLIGVAAILVIQKDLGTLIVITLVSGIIYFTAKTPGTHAIIIVVLFIAGVVSLILMEPYRLNRLTTFLHPQTEVQGTGYHINQSLYALGSGGIFGKGLGLGEQRFGFLPEPTTDSIFAAFGEETGFVGTSAVIILFLVLGWRGIKTAKAQTSDFLQSTVIGITAWFVIQAFINIGAITGILPLTGVPLPFISYGSSAFVCELMALGLLLNISKNSS